LPITLTIPDPLSHTRGCTSSEPSAIVNESACSNTVSTLDSNKCVWKTETQGQHSQDFRTF
jgi:hypothetical protein